MGRAMFSKCLIQFSVDGWDCVPSLLFGPRPNYGRINGTSFKRACASTVVFYAHNPIAGHLAQSLVGQSSFLLAPGVHKTLSVPPRHFSPNPMQVLQSNPTGLQGQILWGFSVPLPDHRVSLVVQTVKHLPAVRETWVLSLGWEDPLEKEMATYSSTLSWKIPCTEEPGRLQSMGSKESDTTERLHFARSPGWENCCGS